MTNEVTQIMISKLSEIDVMTVSQILSLLEKHDFVKRKEHSRDTRAKVVILNKKGEEILQTAVPLIEQIDEFFSESWITTKNNLSIFLLD